VRWAFSCLSLIAGAQRRRIRSYLLKF
jgi:hypothetical protein